MATQLVSSVPREAWAAGGAGLHRLRRGAAPNCAVESAELRRIARRAAHDFGAALAVAIAVSPSSGARPDRALRPLHPNAASGSVAPPEVFDALGASARPNPGRAAPRPGNAAPRRAAARPPTPAAARPAAAARRPTCSARAQLRAQLVALLEPSLAVRSAAAARQRRRRRALARAACRPAARGGRGAASRRAAAASASPPPPSSGGARTPRAAAASRRRDACSPRMRGGGRAVPLMMRTPSNRALMPGTRSSSAAAISGSRLFWRRLYGDSRRCSRSVAGRAHWAARRSAARRAAVRVGDVGAQKARLMCGMGARPGTIAGTATARRPQTIAVRVWFDRAELLNSSLSC